MQFLCICKGKPRRARRRLVLVKKKSIWGCIVWQEELMLCDNLVSAENAWKFGLMSFWAEIWIFYPSDTPQELSPSPCRQQE